MNVATPSVETLRCSDRTRLGSVSAGPGEVQEDVTMERWAGGRQFLFGKYFRYSRKSSVDFAPECCTIYVFWGFQ
eukprot:4444138-Amphidinium_carterae.3